MTGQVIQPHRPGSVLDFARDRGCLRLSGAFKKPAAAIFVEPYDESCTARRAIYSKASMRGDVGEYIISTVTPAG